LGCSDALPSYGQALVVIETDLSAPAVAGRLRIDTYTENGIWIESRDIARPDPRDWPASFGVFTKSEASRTVILRLRAYPEGAVRDYLGERFADWPDLLAGKITAGDGTPRLVIDNHDVTPKTEPDPLLTVDRLVRIRLTYGVEGRVRVKLHADCAGTMARLPGESCVDQPHVRAAITDAVLEPQLDTPASAPHVAPCQDGTAERACVPGGSTVLGDARIRSWVGLAPFPPRVAQLSDFMMDRREVTVARFRDAIVRGFAPPVLPTANEGTLGTAPDDMACTWSAATKDREDHALTCVDVATARAFCAFEGGEVPTEAQWEYATLTAGRTLRVDYPWGDDVPSCERAVYGRTALAGFPGVCESYGKGPRPSAESATDVNPLGIQALGGGVAELVLDGYAEYTSACWRDATVTDPHCDDLAGGRIARGGSWAAPPPAIRPPLRVGPNVERKSFIGFRCVYPAR
jgi:formylglycine-generating enzyme required for sulfatase activity